MAAKELEAFAGKYKMTGLPFEFIQVTVKDGALRMDAGGSEGELTPTAEASVFSGANGLVISFGRNADQKVTLSLKVQGMSFEGTKQ